VLGDEADTRGGTADARLGARRWSMGAILTIFVLFTILFAILVAEDGR
jgi:hypothetical protein